MIRRNVIIAILIVLSLVIFSACSNSQTSLKIGDYFTDDMSIGISINKDNSFSISSPASSDFESTKSGTYVIKENIVTLTTDNGDNYLFEIKENSLIFQQNGSSEYHYTFKLNDGDILT